LLPRDAKYGLEKISRALAFVVAYFSQDKTEFCETLFFLTVRKFGAGHHQHRFNAFVGDLHNPEQMALVAGGEMTTY